MSRSLLVSRGLACGLVCGLAWASHSSGSQSAPLLSGFSAAAGARQLQVEQRLADSVSAARIREHSLWLTARPHRAGSEGARLTAEYIRDRLEEYGLEAEIVRYDAFLTEPVEVSVGLVEPVVRELPGIEERVPGDPFTDAAAEHPGWNGYSATGDVTGQVVYARYGSESDFRHLVEQGIDLEGKVVLLRYFGAGEGRKVHNAERFGAAAVVLYADPAEDGFPYGLVYPEGDWRPPGSIMRRSVEFLPFSGDPLSPGWASGPGADRLAPDDVSLPRIPVVPVSYASAEEILSHLAGPAAPPEWQGRLPLTYRLGPGPAKLRVRALMDNGDRPMLNVVGRLTGGRDPDEMVILGNHHDAWIFGAGDPSSGTAALLELARTLGALAEEGWRPDRTVVLGFWDAEEMLLGGSTEWVEDNAEQLLEHAIANINMDSAIFNAERPLRVAGHTVLHRLFREAAHAIPHPLTGASLFETWTDMQNDSFAIPSVDGFGEFLDRDRRLEEPWIFESPSDDAAPFFDYLALPASDMYYGGDYGMYHSIYENFHWMSTVVDPDFALHRMMALLQGVVGLRLANADVVPLDYAEEARFWHRAYQDLSRVAADRGQEVPRLDEALALIDEWERQANLLDQTIRQLLTALGDAEAPPVGDQTAIQDLNRRFYLLARDFYRAEGSPGRPYNKNMFSGWAYDFEQVSGSTLPGLRFALDQGKDAEAGAEADVYIDALRRRVDNLRGVLASIR